MTIKAFLDGLPDLQAPNGQTIREAMADTMPIWTNNACSGYTVAAMMEAGFTRDEIHRVLVSLNEMYHALTVEDAERALVDF